MGDLIHELSWRGLIQDRTEGLEEALSKGMVSGYVGFDPTAPSLTIGNLVSIMLLVHLQRAGHKPIALVGGATGMIGDPSGKSAERNLLDLNTLRFNEGKAKKQLEKFLRFDGENAAEVVNNYDWMKDFSFLAFMRDVGKHLTVNYMMAKESVKKRLETGISFTEFSYQLLQAYDFYHLYQTKHCLLQMGGSDQWGNITSGTELIRRMAGGSAFALTSPLITKADGTKFGKSEQGNVWLDPEMTSPYAFYQFWLNVGDVEAGKYLRIFTLLDQPEIEQLEREHAEAPHNRLLQKKLASEVTLLVHGQAELDQAISATSILFGQGSTEQLRTMSESLFLNVFEGVPQCRVSRQSIATDDIVTLLSQTTNGTIFSSKGEARKMIDGGGLSINKGKVEKPDVQLSESDLLNGKYVLVQKGKKNYFLITVE